MRIHADPDTDPDPKPCVLCTAAGYRISDDTETPYRDCSADTGILAERHGPHETVVERNEPLLEIERSLVPVQQLSHQLERHQEVDGSAVPKQQKNLLKFHSGKRV
jgi:hypothetical protein